jgi:hypothetical protein
MANHIDRLLKAGTDKAAFDAAFSDLSADKSVTKDHANDIARDYTESKVNFPTRSAALKEIQTSFKERHYEQTKMVGVDKASKY